MRINKDSLFFYLTLTFGITFFGVNASLVFFSHTRYMKELHHKMGLAHHAKDVILHGNDLSSTEINQQLEGLGFSLPANHDVIRNKGKEIERLPFGNILEWEGTYYFQFFPRPSPPLHDKGFAHDRRFLPPPLFDDERQMEHQEPRILLAILQPEKLWNQETLLLFVLVNGLLLGSYAIIVKKLYRLIPITQAIQRFGQGELNWRCHVSGDDEIARVAQEFDKTAHQVNDLLQARTLLLRNFLHELKTPITTARLTAAVVNDERLKHRLDKAFERIDTVVNQAAWIEKLASGLMKTSLEICDSYEVIEEALTRLDKTIDDVVIVGENVYYCDKELLITAVKNLLDNSLRHAQSEVWIECQEESIKVANMAAPLRYDFSAYLVPFNRDYEGGRGLGLGLWIVSRIMEIMNGKLRYRYHEGWHEMTLFFQVNEELMSK